MRSKEVRPPGAVCFQDGLISGPDCLCLVLPVLYLVLTVLDLVLTVSAQTGGPLVNREAFSTPGDAFAGDEKQGFSAKQVPVSAYVGSSKNLKDLKERVAGARDPGCASGKGGGC